MMVYISGARWIGGRFARFLEKDVLAEPLEYRGVIIPARSRLTIDGDFDDVTIDLAAPTTIHGVCVPTGTTIRFRGRLLGFAGLRVPIWFWPIYFPLAWHSKRKTDRDVEVVSTGAVIRPK